MKPALRRTPNPLTFVGSATLNVLEREDSGVEDRARRTTQVSAPTNAAPAMAPWFEARMPEF